MTVAGAFARVGEAPLALALAAGVFGVVKFSWVFWLAGCLWGGNVVQLLAGSPPDGTAKRRRSILARDEPASRWIIGTLSQLLPCR